jgi:hypothetical protein
MTDPQLLKNKYIFILVLFTLIFFLKPLLNPSQILYSPFSDLISADLFWKYVMHDSFQRFWEIPLWNPYTFSGMPFLAHHFSKMLYPLNFPFFIFDNAETLFNYLYPLHFFLAGLFMYFFVRVLEVGRFGSFVASIIYVFNGHYVMFIYAGLPNELPLMAFLPLALYLFELSVKREKFFYAILSGLSLSMIILGAHTQKTFYGFLFFLVYAIFRTIVLAKSEGPTPSYKIALFSISAILIGVLVAMAQILPSLEILEYSSRAGGIDYDFASSGSFPPWQLVSIVIPNFFGTLLHENYWGNYPFWQLSIYIGILPIILLLFAFLKRNLSAYFFGGTALLSLLFAFGKYTPFHHALYQIVPFFDTLRGPSRSMFFFVFSLAILSAFGAQHLTEIKSQSSLRIAKKIIIGGTLLLAFSFALFLGTLFFKETIINYGNELLESKYSNTVHTLRPFEYYQGKIDSSFQEIQQGLLKFLVILSLSLLALFMWNGQRISLAALKIFIVILIIADLWGYSMPFIMMRDPSLAYPSISLPTYVEKDPSMFRVFDLSSLSLPQATAVRHGIQLAGGYDGMILGDYQEYATIMGGETPKLSTVIPISSIRHHAMLDLLNVKYLVSTREISDEGYALEKTFEVLDYTNNEQHVFFERPPEDPLFTFFGKKQVHVYKNTDVLPRAFVVGNSIVTQRSNILGILQSRDFNPRNLAVLERALQGKIASEFKEAEILFYSPNKLIVRTDLDAPGLLVLSEVWYPGWKALDNGQKTEIYRANYLFRAVYLEKGEHTVEFAFQPTPLHIGAWISFFSLLFIAGYTAHYFRNEKR